MSLAIHTIDNIREDLLQKSNTILNKNNIKPLTFLLGSIFFLFPDTADALNGGGIVGIDNLWAQIKPYLASTFSVGGVVYCLTNVRKVVIGDYRAAAPAAISAVIAGLGVNGIFGQNALTALLPN